MAHRENFIALRTKCTWVDDLTGNQLTGWVVVQPGFCEGYYTLSTKYKHPTWDKDDKAYFKLVEASKLNVVS